MLEEKNDANIEEAVEPVQEDDNRQVGGESQTREAATEETKEEQAQGATGSGSDEHIKHVQNWRSLREKAERAERERDAALQQLQEREQFKVKSQEDNNRQPAEDLQISDDDLLEGKHLKSYEKIQQQRLSNLEGQLIEAQLKSNYPDFDKVVTQDTLGMLRDADPELADSIAANPNIYSKAVAAYKTIKRYGFAGTDMYSKEKEKVSVNTSKPRPVTSLSPQQGESPLSRANAFAEGLTPELAKELWKEMQECRKKT